MDSYSGSCPQRFISFHLDMTTEKKSPEPTTTPVVENEEMEAPEIIELPSLDRPSLQVSEGSRSTGESVTAFIERTVEVMSQPDTETVDPLPNQQGATAPARMVTVNPSFLKISVSEPITVRNDSTHIEVSVMCGCLLELPSSATGDSVFCQKRQFTLPNSTVPDSLRIVPGFCFGAQMYPLV